MSHEHDDVRASAHPQAAELTKRIMKRQAALSLRVAFVFVLVLVAVPLVNLYMPSTRDIEVLGFPLPWFILAILFFPLTWALSNYFVKASEKLDSQIVAEESANGGKSN